MRKRQFYIVWDRCFLVETTDLKTVTRVFTFTVCCKVDKKEHAYLTGN